MQALILVGGEATRLRPLTCHMPKAMCPVINKPFLEHFIRYLGRHQVKDIVLAQGHLPKIMADYFLDGSRLGAKLTYSLENKPMNTAGAVKNAEKHLKGRFLVFNGDIFTDLDIAAMLQFHLERKARVTIALTPVEDPTAYGLIETDVNGRITRFLEKPRKEEVTTNMINAGAYILEPEVLADIPAQTNYSFERQLFPGLLQRGAPLFAFPSQGYWIDIGTPDKYFQVHRDLLNGKSRGYEKLPGQEIQIGRGSRIDSSASLQGPVLIEDNCTIEAGVQITGPVVLGQGSTVQEKAIIQESIAWQNVNFGERASVKKSLIANDCYLGSDCSVEQSVIGDHIILESKTKLGPGSHIWPSIHP